MRVWCGLYGRQEGGLVMEKREVIEAPTMEDLKDKLEYLKEMNTLRIDTFYETRVGKKIKSHSAVIYYEPKEGV